MHLLIWMIGLMLLMLWSTAIWMGYSISHFAMTLPWDQASTELKNMQIPELFKPLVEPILLIFADGSWDAWVDSLAPLTHWLSNLLQGSASWVASALPVIAWIIWGLGALLVIALAAGGSAALWYFRRRSRASGGSGGATGAASL